ncbi:MAG TPA: phosphate acyltransferase, partial [Devosia sp.]|nr:phosphate acyltransferase [Devosia sp.]
MVDSIRISVDAMGGDIGPRVAIEGAWLALRERRNVSFIFHGREAELTPLLEKFPDLKAASRIVHCDNVISMDEKPAQALRKGRGNSSMWAAIQSVKDGDADVVISGGNTGALMAMSLICLRP